MPAPGRKHPLLDFDDELEFWLDDPTREPDLGEGRPVDDEPDDFPVAVDRYKPTTADLFKMLKEWSNDNDE